MPTYEYECKKCGHKFEEFQSITEPPLRRCPECKGRVQRLIGTGAGIIFKGKGFYATDYRSPAYHETAKKEREAAAGPVSDKPGEKRKNAVAKDTSKSEKKADP